MRVGIIVSNEGLKGATISDHDTKIEWAVNLRSNTGLLQLSGSAPADERRSTGTATAKLGEDGKVVLDGLDGRQVPFLVFVLVLVLAFRALDGEDVGVAHELELPENLLNGFLGNGTDEETERKRTEAQSERYAPRLAAEGVNAEGGTTNEDDGDLSGDLCRKWVTR